MDSTALEMAKQIVNLAREQSSLIGTTNSLLRNQTDITRQLFNILASGEEASLQTNKNLSEILKGVEKLDQVDLSNLNDSLNQAKKNSEEATSALDICGNILKKLVVGGFTAAVWAMKKFWDMLKLAGGIVSTAVGAIFDVIGAVLDLGKSILSLPFAAYSWLIGKANELMSGGGSAYAEAIRALKTEYGALDQVAPSTIMKISRETQTVSKHGLSAFRIWGSLGERMKALTELAQKMGPTFENFAQEFADTGLQIPALLKGLGLTDEQYKVMGERAKTMGTRFQDELVEMHKQSWALGGAFEHSTKLINRDMAKAMGDVKRFGAATTAQIGQSVVYARSLGVELEKIAGILDAFETFEGAADVASKFAQAFDVHIEAFEMLNAQDAGTVIDHIRKKFAEAGRDASTFNRAQLDILTQGSKLAPEVAKQVFSLKNQGRSLEEIQKESEKAQNSFGNLDSALNDLRKSIEYLVMSGSMPKGGFLDMFLAGIERGINLNPHTRGLFRDIARGLKTTFYDARTVLDGFIKYFPGVEDAIKGLRDVFNPGKLGTLIRGFNDEIIKFFKLFAKGQMTFGELFDNLSGRVKDYFNSTALGGSKVLDGLKLFGRSVAKIAGEVIEWIGSALADGIRSIAGFIRNPDSVLKAGSGVLDGAVKVGESLWQPLWKGLNNAVDELLPALEDLFNSLLERVPILRTFMSLFDETEYRSKKAVTIGQNFQVPFGDDDEKLDFSKTFLIEDVNATPEKTIKLFKYIRDYWDEIKFQFDQFINDPGGIFSQFVDALVNLKDSILTLLSGIVILGGINLAGRAFAGSGGVSGIYKLVGGLLAAGATGYGVSKATDIVQFFTSSEGDKKTSEGGTKSSPTTVNGEIDANVSSQQKLSLDIQNRIEGVDFLGGSDFTQSAKQLGDYLTNLQTGLGEGTIKLDDARKASFIEMLKKHERSAAKIKRDADLTKDKSFDMSAFMELQQKISDTRKLLGDDSKPTDPARSTDPKEKEKRILPSVAVDTLKSMTFSDTSEALKMLTDDIEGKGAFKGLVRALFRANEDIKANEGISSAKNVSEFFMHVEQVAASLGGLQRLVDIVGIDGISNFQVVLDNIKSVEQLFFRLITDGSINLIVGHIGRLSTVLPSNDLTQKVRDFFEHLDDITNRLKVLSGSESTEINATRIGDSVKNTAKALDALREHIPTLRTSVQNMSNELSNAKNSEGTSASSLMTTLSKSLTTFKTDFETVASALITISDLESQFSGEVPRISESKIKLAIAKMSDSIGALSSAMTTSTPTGPIPPLDGRGPLIGDVSPGLSSSLDSFVGERGALKPEFSALSGRSGKLTVFNKFISGVASQIGSDTSEGTILGSMRVFSNFSDNLAGYKAKFDQLDLTVLKTFVEKMGTDLPDPSKVDFSKISTLAQKLSLNGLDENLAKINSVLGTAKSIAENIRQSSLNIETITDAVENTAIAFGGAGTGPDALTITPPNIKIFMTVKVSIKAGDAEAAILQGSNVIVDKLNEAVQGQSLPPGSGMSTSSP